MYTRVFLAAAAAFAFTTSASAVTVENVSAGEVTIGIDFGDQEKIKEIPAGKSVTFDCKDGCGISGPWLYSWRAKGNDVIKTDGQSIVSVNDIPHDKNKAKN